jgi:hypothetical protein
MTEELSRKMVASSTNFRDARSLSALATAGAETVMVGEFGIEAAFIVAPGTPPQ